MGRVHLRTGRILAVSAVAGLPGADKDDVATVEYVLAEDDGTALQRGMLAADLPADIDFDTVVLADYSLIEHPEVLKLPGHPVGLVVPGAVIAGTAACVVREWTTESRSARAVVAAAELDALRDHIGTRRELALLRDRLYDEITDRVAVSREYLETLSGGGPIPEPLFPLLRKYPTPRTIDPAGALALAQAVDQTSLYGESIIDRLLQLVERSAVGHTIELELSEALLPGDIDRYLTLQDQLRALDLTLYDAVRSGTILGDAASASLPSRDNRSFSLFTLGPAEPASLPGVITTDPAALLAGVEEAYARRSTSERNPGPDYETYRAAQACIELDVLPAEAALRLNIAGQHLALASGDFFEAIRCRTACDRMLASATDDLSDGVRADASLSLAITEMCAVDFVQGFASLRLVVESELAAAASPELFTEALGLMGFVIVTFGEYEAYPEALRLARERIDEHGGSGTSRALTDIADFFLSAGRPDADPAEVEALRERADVHSRDTVYRSYYHYIAMIAAHLTKDVEQGIWHYTQIQQEGLWARFNRRFDKLSRLAYAIHLAARGEFAAARRELSTHVASYKSVSDGAEYLIQGLFGLRLDLAVGQHQNVLAETMPNGALGELRIQRVHLRRYSAISLVLRGTALLREGESEMGVECFARATQHAVLSDEWFALLAGETLEYRAWLESLEPADPEGLPGGISPSLLAAILSRPVLIRHNVEPLTPQQARILRLLAQNRSAASIAAELHISPNTLKTHMRQLYQRLGVRSRDQAVLYAEMYGLFSAARTRTDPVEEFAHRVRPAGSRA